MVLEAQFEKFRSKLSSGTVSLSTLNRDQISPIMTHIIKIVVATKAKVVADAAIVVEVKEEVVLILHVSYIFVMVMKHSIAGIILTKILCSLLLLQIRINTLPMVIPRIIRLLTPVNQELLNHSTTLICYNYTRVLDENSQGIAHPHTVYDLS